MKKVVPALAIALMAGIGGSSAAQAAVHIIDFSIGVNSADPGGDLSYIPAGTSRLDQSTSFVLDGSNLVVDTVFPDDNTSGPISGNPVSITPTTITYGSLSGEQPAGTPLPGDVTITKSWVASDGDVFTELLTDVADVNRESRDDIIVKLTGTVSDTLGIFKGSLASMTLAATQDGGVGTAVSVSLTNFAETSTVPEPATWVMMALGFVGLGYAAVRRNSKDRRALAI
jgi:hypothetical protein